MHKVEKTDAQWRDQLTPERIGPLTPQVRSCALEQRSQGLQSS